MLLLTINRPMLSCVTSAPQSIYRYLVVQLETNLRKPLVILNRDVTEIHFLFLEYKELVC